MELRMHSLVWNRVVIFLSDEQQEPDILRDDHSLAFIVPYTDDYDALVEFMHSHLVELEAELRNSQSRVR